LQPRNAYAASARIQKYESLLQKPEDLVKLKNIAKEQDMTNRKILRKAENIAEMQARTLILNFFACFEIRTYTQFLFAIDL